MEILETPLDSPLLSMHKCIQSNSDARIPHIMIFSAYILCTDSDVAVQSQSCENLLLFTNNVQNTDIPKESCDCLSAGVSALHFGDDDKMFLEELKAETQEIKTHYSHVINSFSESFLRRERKGDVTFDDIKLPVIEIFVFGPSHPFNFTNSKQLIKEIRCRQSYMNFDLLKALIKQCGSRKDLKQMQNFSEAFTNYAKRRILQCEPDLIDSELPDHETVVFVLDSDQSFMATDAFEFRFALSKVLGMKYQQIILGKVKVGSIVLYFMIPSKYIRPITLIPLCRNIVVFLQSWHTHSIVMKGQEIFNLGNFNVLRDVDFNDVPIVDVKGSKVLAVDYEGEKYMALHYVGQFYNESSADTGYIDYLKSILSGEHMNLPAIKGVFYHPVSLDRNQPYPSIIVENMTSLKDVLVDQEVSQISVLLDIVNSFASFKKSALKFHISVFPDSVFVRNNLSELEARFCPLYSHSFISDKKVDSEVASGNPLQLSELWWMKDLVKFMYFHGNVKEQSELPNNHILKTMFDQKWLSTNDQIRQFNLKKLSEEIQSMLGKFNCYCSLYCCFINCLNL